MCTEFFLVLIYFFVLFFINFLLFNLLKSYLKKISFFKKFLILFTSSQKKSIKNLSIFYLIRKNNKKQEKFFFLFNLSSFPINDILLLGNLFAFLFENSDSSFEKIYYFNLLKRQYLSFLSKKTK